MKTTVTIIGILIVAAAGVYLFLQRDAAQLVFDDSVTVSESVLSETQVFMERRVILESLKLDFSILEDAQFTSLRTFTKPIKERPKGRTNPFEAPVVP